VVAALLKDLLKDVDPRRYAALRIAFGLLLTLTLLGHFGGIALNFSDEGWLSASTAVELRPFPAWSVLGLITSAWGARIVFGTLLVFAVAFTLGIRTRLSAWICFAGLLSIENRNPVLAYGGDMALRVFLFYLALSRCGDAWSIDAGRRKGQRPKRVAAWPLRLLQFQVAMIYLSSGLAKLHGADWSQGEALHLALLNPAIARADWSGWLEQAWIQGFLRYATWMTVVWEVLFPLLILFRRSRPAALLVGVAVHGSLLLLARLHWLGPIMLASYLAFVPAESLAAWAKALSSRVCSR
jgi:hypothetical protein